ncbi:MAG: nuoL [Rhodospirillales bacterium]|nr:nuoL [Rhodospirillales bacterium]
MLEAICILLPLLAAAIAGLGNRRLGDRGAQFVTCGALILSAIIGVYLFADVALGHHPRTVKLFSWIASGDFRADWALRFDTLTAVMVVVVTVVSACVHVYSVGYMSHDHSKPRFMAYLSLFTFMMLALVTADNFLQLFFGWEGVGLASYLLIGFWFHKASANDAAIKAFLVNRVGDMGFALGIMAVFAIFGSIEFNTVFDAAASKNAAMFNFLGYQVPALTTACLLLFIGAMGKSAQLGLHTWLPDAMEGPTPVSALIHAATMVTAGVFMLCRCSPLFSQAPDALAVVCVVGSLTAFVAATIGLTQWDIKRVIAYSTMSQLGYMFFAIGVGAYAAAIFHLMTHAFFKALLFLGAGSVIHAIDGEQDMRNMGGLRKAIPKTHMLMWIGSLALAGIGIPGIYGFAGFYSKDAILEASWAAGGIGQTAFWLGIAAALFTAFYSWRLIYLTFFGKFRGDHHVLEHAHESPPVMLIPLYVLAAGALFAGLGAYNWFVGHDRAAFWGTSIVTPPGRDPIEAAHHVPEWVSLAPLAVGIVGILLASWFYLKRTDLPKKVAAAFSGIYVLVFRKYYFDELYDAVFVRPALWLGRVFWKRGDEGLIDTYGPDAIASNSQRFAGFVSRFQTGYLYQYAFVMLIGVVLFTTWFLWRGH